MGKENGPRYPDNSYIVAFAGRHEKGLALVERACKLKSHLPLAFISSFGECYHLVRRNVFATMYRTAPKASRALKKTRPLLLADPG